ncbi:hypothetical protein BD560DRAFT_439585, partial [Blakeslea trispora]
SIAGVLSAHVYYYLTHIYPSQGGRRYLQTPAFLKRLFPARTARGFQSGGFRAGFSQQDQARGRSTGLFSGTSWGPGRRLDS